MRILAIRGRNLASLAGDFAVDFQAEPLAGAGLFAISGPTGAGKSTLLDALCLALYDDTPRLASADGRGVELPDVGKETTFPNDRRNLLRRGCAEGHAEVDFVGNDGVAYRARWSVRRARARIDGKLQQSEVALLRLTDLQPVGGHLKSEVLKAIAQRVGLSFGQFTRAVLLAQNEFFAFLKAGEDERAALLQTLTGTERFEQISRRAFERNKLEQEKLRALKAHLADQQPASPEARAGLEAGRTKLRAAVAEQETRAKSLIAQLQWRHELERAHRREAEAQAALASALDERAAAEARRTRLAAVEAVQPARPLLAETDRLAEERALVARQAAEAEATAAAAALAVQEAAKRLEAAELEAQEGEAIAARFAPRLLRARELDTEIGTLGAARAKAADSQREAAAALEAARADQTANGDAQQAARVKLAAAREWLAAHAQLAPLAEGWMRWDTLFAAARQEHRRGAEADAEVERLAAEAQGAARAAGEAATRETEAAAAVREREAACQTALAALREFDGEALARRRTDLEARHQALLAAQSLWRELAMRTEQLLEDQANVISLRRRLENRRERLAAVRAGLPAAEAQASQAEYAWKVLYEATQATAESLRNQLHPHAPCPVCGALEHPYVTHPPALDDALSRLAGNLDRCRAALTDLAAEGRSLQTEVDGLGEQLAAMEARLALRRTGHTQALGDWERAEAAWIGRFPEARPLPARDDTQAMAEWFLARHAELQEDRQAADKAERRGREAGEAARAAQGALEEARTRREAARHELVRLRALAETCASALEAAQAARARSRLRLAELLSQLDDAHAGQGDHAQGWRAAWAAEPDAHYAGCKDQAVAWKEKQQTFEASGAALSRLEAEARGLVQVARGAETTEDRARSALLEIDRSLKTAIEARRAVFADLALPRDVSPRLATLLGDLSPDEIESRLARALQAARAGITEAGHAAGRAAEERARGDAMLAQLRARGSDLAARAEAAGKTLETWRAGGHATHAAGPMELPELRTLLAYDERWIADERRALHKLDTEVAVAQGALAQARSHREGHERTRPPTDSAAEDPTEEIERALREAERRLAALREHSSEVELAVRRDDEIRAKAASLLEEIEAQEHAARIWWQMNELIGAADGKKFRNQAQQLTLDILLAYANAHLHDLAPRYRLERVAASLALMVIDQDMGDEQRSVHSLSGGESFLVSLALALGLASLSSHRVRVESLFIDEGFGSLDTDTLRVAMDALDRLQALGRKVGVISHVQEMTDRIGPRVEVRRLPGGRSRIEVCNAR